MLTYPDRVSLPALMGASYLLVLWTMESPSAYFISASSEVLMSWENALVREGPYAEETYHGETVVKVITLIPLWSPHLGAKWAMGLHWSYGLEVDIHRSVS